MKIIELEIGNIRTIKFNENGLSIIKASKTLSDDTKKDKRSVNGSGKSLIIAFIHYCLGGSKELAKSLKLDVHAEYIQYVKLTVTHNSNRYTFTRKPKESFVLINNEKVYIQGKKENITTWLFKHKIFTPQVDCSAYSMLKRFMRDGVAYSKYKVCGENEKDDDIHKYTAYLLGLDYDKVCKKIEIKEELKRLKIFTDQLKKDASSTSDAKRGQIINDIARLEKDLSDMKIAVNYSDIQTEADRIKFILQEKRNTKSKIEYSLKDIANSLLLRKDLDVNQIDKLFSEINLVMPDKIMKRFEDVENFNKALIDDRNNILRQEQVNFNRSIEVINAEITILEKELDNQLQFLKTHHAIDEYVAIINKKNALESELKEIDFNAKSLMNSQLKIAHQKTRLQEENEQTIGFLESVYDTIIRNAQAQFCSIAHKMYGDKPASLKIENNVGDNKIRYNIDAKIDYNTKGGVNHVTIFCWDWMLLLLKNNHHIDFIFHDSNIFEGVDSRQISAMINFAKEQCDIGGKQYIFSINYDQYTECEERVKAIINNKDNIILDLSDINDDSKLLKKKLENFDY